MDQPHEIHWRAAKRILNFFREEELMGSSTKLNLILIRLGLLTVIGQVTTQIEIQHQDMCSCLLKDQSADQARNRVPLHSHLQKQSREEL